MLKRGPLPICCKLKVVQIYKILAQKKKTDWKSISIKTKILNIMRINLTATETLGNIVLYFVPCKSEFSKKDMSGFCWKLFN